MESAFSSRRAALELGDDLDGIVTYDDRFAAAAAHHGVAVVAPS